MAEVQVKVPNRVNPHTHQFLNFKLVVTTFNLMETAVRKSYIFFQTKIGHHNVTRTIRIERGIEEWTSDTLRPHWTVSHNIMIKSRSRKALNH